MKSLTTVFEHIEEKLNKELIGQGTFLNQLCDYFKKNIEENERGILLIVGEKDTAKKTSIRLLFEALHSEGLILSKEVDELDLGSYDFNLGYNAFLTDLYEKLASPSEGLLFKNTEKASESIRKVLASLYPNSCVALEHNYMYKNRFLMEAGQKVDAPIDQLVCKHKFLIFTSNQKELRVDDASVAQFVNNIDCTLCTQSLTTEDKNKVVQKEVVKAIEQLKQTLQLELFVNITDSDQRVGEKGLCYFLQESYSPDSGFGISKYVRYRLTKPVRNLVNKENIQQNSKMIIDVENQEIFCTIDQGRFRLSEYSMPTLEEANYKLSRIIGIKQLKHFMENIQNNYRVQQIRERLGLTTSTISMNMIFAGNAGTGKTNAARVTFEYLNALGILKKEIFKEVSKADFVSENASDTARRTHEVVQSALGGVLFIDEAYSLCESEEDKVGKEIVDALLKEIEDNRENLVVILAGYEKDMENFLSMNSGLKSRFPNVIVFEDYSPTQMYEIAVNIAKGKGYRIAEDVRTELIELFTKNQMIGKNDLGNARFVRNIVENAILDASKKYLTESHKSIDLLEADNFNFKVKAKFDLDSKLQNIIGLEEVKKLLRSQYQLIVAQEKRRSVGVETKIEQNLNMVFAGNPGTGKTSIARLVADMFNSMGLLKIGQLIETDRSSFVSEVPGETAKKTEAKFKEAIGGILFIDEAYTLANDSLGREAIETLLKLIEDHSREVIVILAGYEKEMEDFFDVNIGLRSRFPLWTLFEDYKPDELVEMAIKHIEGNGFKVSKNALVALKKSFAGIYENADAQSGNGRMVRNYVETLIRNQSIRIAESDISVYEMNLITSKDIEMINLSEYGKEFNLEKTLKTLVASEKVKTFLRNQYKIMKVKERREKLGIRGSGHKYMHMVFTGEIGTGKKTVLKLLAEIYYSLGIIKSKAVVQIDTAQLMAIMNDGKKVEDILNKYIGKMIVIDKAPMLFDDSVHQEMIGELTRFIDKSKNKLIIVLSGGKNPLRMLIQDNPSMNYRFPLWLDFENYQEPELVAIATDCLRQRGFTLTEQAAIELSQVVSELVAHQYLSLDNALMIKDYVGKVVDAQSIRAYEDNLNLKELNVIEPQDFKVGRQEFLRQKTVIMA